MIIAISGKIGSGKDTLGTILKDKLIKAGYKNVEIKKFAHNLKAATAIISGLMIEDMYSEEGKKKYVPVYGKTVGELQQIIGTLLRDYFDNEVWIKSVLSSYDREKDIYIITDLRFKNEAEAVRSSGPHLLVRLNGDPVGINQASNRDKTHISECDLDDYNDFGYVYDNVGSLEGLNNYAQYLVGQAQAVDLGF